LILPPDYYSGWRGAKATELPDDGEIARLLVRNDCLRINRQRQMVEALQLNDLPKWLLQQIIKGLGCYLLFIT
jgi:hypothetical protein